jgi:tetratricopeptide (TPR) repeat protein
MRFLFKSIFFILPVLMFCNCVGMAASAQEYYSIGMAYFELGKYEEAERWLNRARAADKTMTASQYNLGRLAFETGRYNEAAEHFEDILSKDQNNVLALRAAAYTRIKTGDLAAAEKHYAKLLEIVPESADNGYNHALVLYAMERYADAQEVLEKYPFALLENNDALLLYARSQKAQDNVEAIDSYAKWLSVNSDPAVRYEYAGLLEHNELYARALEEYRKVLSETAGKDSTPKRSEIRFSLARLLLIADGESGEGVVELETAVNEGFDDIEAVQELLDMKISAAHIDSIRNIINNMQRAADAAPEPQVDQNEADMQDELDE